MVYVFTISHHLTTFLMKYRFPILKIWQLKIADVHAKVSLIGLFDQEMLIGYSLDRKNELRLILWKKFLSNNFYFYLNVRRILVTCWFLDFLYYGLQNGNECYCGNSDKLFIPTYPSECNKKCNGNLSQLCGGSWRLNIFQNDQQKLNSILKNQTIPTNVENKNSATTAITTLLSTEIPDNFVVNITGTILTNQLYDEIIADEELHMTFINKAQIELELMFASTQLGEIFIKFWM